MDAISLIISIYMLLFLYIIIRTMEKKQLTLSNIMLCLLFPIWLPIVIVSGLKTVVKNSEKKY